MSALGAFNTQLIRFFEELVDTYPEERDIKLGLDAIQAAKKINPKLILDLFFEHVYRDLNEAIQAEDEQRVIEYAHAKIAGQFNEMSSALVIFDKHWMTMAEPNQKAIWKYLKVLCVLCEKARAAKVMF
jgi:GTP1/Obg family GTP-binding protein